MKPHIIMSNTELNKLKIQKKSEFSFYEPISLHTLKNDIFVSSKYELLVDEFMKKNERLIQYPFIDLKFIVVKEMINNQSIPSFMKFLEMNDNLYYIYEGTLRLSKDGIHSNDKKTFIDKLIKWHN